MCSKVSDTKKIPQQIRNLSFFSWKSTTIYELQFSQGKKIIDLPIVSEWTGPKYLRHIFFSFWTLNTLFVTLFFLLAATYGQKAKQQLTVAAGAQLIFGIFLVATNCFHFKNENNVYYK